MIVIIIFVSHPAGFMCYFPDREARGESQNFSAFSFGEAPSAGGE